MCDNECDIQGNNEIYLRAMAYGISPEQFGIAVRVIREFGEQLGFKNINNIGNIGENEKLQGIYDFCLNMMLDASVGNGLCRVVPHHNVRVLEAISNMLISLILNSRNEGVTPTIRMGMISCPAFETMEVGGRIVFPSQMRIKEKAVPFTVERAINYVKTLSRRAERFKVPVSFTIWLPAWEVVLSYEDVVARGYRDSEDARDKILKGTIQAIQELLNQEGVSNEYFQCEVEILDLPQLRDKADSLAQKFLTGNEQGHIRYIAEIRADMYGKCNDDERMRRAARDVAEQFLAFHSVLESDIHLLVVPTSPTIASFCLGGREPYPYIQLAHGYRG